MLNKKSVFIFFLFFLTISAAAYATRLPYQETGVEYFYIFGPEANPYYGAYTGDFTLYVEVPDTLAKEVSFKIIDPGTSGKHDDIYKDWNTETEFSVYGDVLLDKKSFLGEENEAAEFQFGPYPTNKGEHIGNKYRFKLVVKAIKGDDANLFAVEVSPEESESYTYGFPIRLAAAEGAQMYFYPAVPVDTSLIVMRNYDLDPDGGIGYLYYTPDRRHKIKDSASGVWATTEVPLKAAMQPQRLKYVITKKTQKHGNAVLSATDAGGNLLPIYFKGGPLDSIQTQKETALTLAPKPRVPEAKKPVKKPAKKEVPKPVKKKIVMPPQAKFVPESETKIPGKCDTFIFDATESYDPNKRPISYDWDFGDGTTSKEAVVTHIYKKPGVYTATLTVMNDTELGCNKDIKTETVKVNFPPQPVLKAPDTGCVGQEITFDGSASEDAAGETLSYAWDFGDGAASNQAVAAHAYAKGGIYKPTLIVQDDSATPCDTSVASRTIRINSAPVIKVAESIKIDEADPDKGLEVKFDASGTYDAEGDALTYIWDFGDGTQDEGVAPTHIYERGGDYTVKLTVTDGSGPECASATANIAVKLNRAPKAVAGEDKDICAGDEVTLDASDSYDNDFDVLTYLWELGDGATKEGMKITHRYEKGGKYNVTLTVDDGRGAVYSKSTSTISVNANQEPFVSLQAPDSACVGEQVSFDASGSYDQDGDVLMYTWDFGDGTKELARVGPLVSHRYEKGGEYVVSVTVDDGKATPCSASRAQVKVKVNAPPVADAGPNKVCCIADPVTFDASRSSDPDGDKLTYLWDFGDGTNTEGAKATHEYTKSGTYTISLVVKDNSGSVCDTATAQFVAEVSESPVSVLKVKPKQ